MVGLVDETEADLQRLIVADLGPSAQALPCRLIDWFHYRARLVARRSRTITLSAGVTEASSEYPAIGQVSQALRDGTDVSPWLSERIRKRKDHRADLMFNAWQISHFHLGAVCERSGRIARSKDLLFAYIDNREAVLLKVANHASWTDRTILEALIETRQSLMDQWWLRGILPGREVWDEGQMHMLRKNGLSTSITIGDKVFSPALGISTSSHATRLVLKTGRFLRALGRLREDIKLNRLVRATQSRVTWPMGVPVRLKVLLTDEGDLHVYDAARNWGFFAEHAAC